MCQEFNYVQNRQVRITTYVYIDICYSYNTKAVKQRTK